MFQNFSVSFPGQLPSLLRAIPGSDRSAGCDGTEDDYRLFHTHMCVEQA